MFLKENQQSIVINYNPMTCIQYLLTIQSKSEHKINLNCFLVVYVIESMDHRFPLNLKEITSIVSLQSKYEFNSNFGSEYINVEISCRF